MTDNKKSNSLEIKRLEHQYMLLDYRISQLLVKEKMSKKDLERLKNLQEDQQKLLEKWKNEKRQ